jgi:hypothetical protein
MEMKIAMIRYSSFSDVGWNYEAKTGYTMDEWEDLEPSYKEDEAYRLLFQDINWYVDEE